MKREFKKKGRETKRLPPEKLYTILCGIYPKEIADEKYAELMGRLVENKPSNGDRIRAKTDEELATWIYMNRWNDIESLLEWLKQESEEE